MDDTNHTADEDVGAVEGIGRRGRRAVELDRAVEHPQDRLAVGEAVEGGGAPRAAAAGPARARDAGAEIGRATFAVEGQRAEVVEGELACIVESLLVLLSRCRQAQGLWLLETLCLGR